MVGIARSHDVIHAARLGASLSSFFPITVIEARNTLQTPTPSHKIVETRKTGLTMGKDNSENEDAVAYMEDFEPQRERASSPLTELEEDVTMASQTQSQKTIPSASQESDKARPKPIKQTETAATSSNKRQRTLESMFGGSAKKAKLDAPAASKDGDKDTQLKRSTISMKSKNAADGPSLNSIPFSQSEFEGSLSTEEKDLLRLELDTMGKSW
jgi:hypothetical protein